MLDLKWDLCNKMTWKLLKAQTLNATELAFFNSKLESKVYTDASDIGIGGTFTQINEKGEERPVRFLSRKLTDTEKRYDTVSKELLAVTYVLQKLRKYLFGNSFTLYTDSNAIKWLFTKKDVNAKHSRYILLLQDFPCKVIHVPGKSNVVADILSRYPLQEPSMKELDDFEHVAALEISSLNYEPLFQYIYLYIVTTSLNQVPEEFQRKVHLQRSSYIVLENKLYKNSSYGPFLVPTLKQRPGVITELHEGHGHFGQEATYKRARTQYYWPHMYENLKKAIKTCHVCQVAEKREPKQISLWPIHTSHLFQRFGIDYVGPLTETVQGFKFLLVITEYYIRWPMAFAVRSADALTSTKIVYNQVFCIFGPPQEILTDRGSHFANAIVANLCQIVKVKHKFSTPYHP